MHLYHLNTRRQPGVHAYLVNLLYAKHPNEIIGYLHQLVNLSLHMPDPIALSALLLDMSAKDHTFALRTLFLLHAQDDYSISDRVEQFAHDLEMVIVNGEKHQRNGIYQMPPHLYPIDGAEDEIEDFQFLRKQGRVEYYSYQVKLANTFCTISATIAKQPQENRECILRMALEFVDDWLSEIRLKHRASHYSPWIKQLFRGIHLPFIFQENLRAQKVLQIVRIAYADAKVFSTRTRAPYFMVIEGVDVNEQADEASVDTGPADVKPRDLQDFVEVLIDAAPEGQSLEKTAQVEAPSSSDSTNSQEQEEEKETYGISLWGEPWSEMVQRLRASSPYGHLNSWSALPILVKGNDDLRQELLAIELMRKIKWIFEEAGLKLFLRPYDILVVNSDSGLIEFIPDTISLHYIKKHYPSGLSIFFEDNWPIHIEEAKANFAESMAGYSLISYILKVKDRHNANILLDRQGHIIHIDFGFMLGNSPGGNLNFENAPFKLTQDMIDVMEGEDSELFSYYKVLMLQGLLELRKHVDPVVNLVEMMLPGTSYPWLESSEKVIKSLRNKFVLGKTDTEWIQHVENLVKKSANNWRTLKYDSYQEYSNGICS